HRALSEHKTLSVSWSHYLESLTAEEREIIKAGSLINFNKNRQM
ncbi:hypothetical protein, partial [Escherichia coli]